MTSIDTDHDAVEPVVIKSSDFIKPSFSDTIPVEYMHTEIEVDKSLNSNYESYCKCYSDAKILSILEKNNIQPNAFKCNKSIMPVPNILCLKMELIDFPFGTYTLNIMGENVKTSKNNIFDFTTESTNAIDEINIQQKKAIETKDSDIPILNSNYLHIVQSDWVSIGHNKKTVLKDIQYVKLFGYILKNNTWKYGEQTVKLYSNNVNKISENYTTPFMDFYFEYDTIFPQPNDIVLTIYIDSHKYIELTHGDIKKKIYQYDYKRFLRIPFIRFCEKYTGSMQNGQPEFIVKNALDFNRVDHIVVITKYITLKNIVQWRYIRYLYPTMISIDSC
jgi:hypothetical protein